MQMAVHDTQIENIIRMKHNINGNASQAIDIHCI